MKKNKFKGLPYPILKNPHGLFRTQSGVNQIKSDLLLLLLTNPGERVMLPDYGTPLKNLLFEPNDDLIITEARNMIAQAIDIWEPRITVDAIDVTTEVDDLLDIDDPGTDKEHILAIKIRFFDPEEIDEVQELVLQLPLG